MALMTATRRCHAPDKKNRRALRLHAGDTGHGGAHQRHLRVHNSNAVTLVPPALPAVTQSGGATTRGGAATHGDDDKQRKLRNTTFQRVPEHLVATGDLPE